VAYSGGRPGEARQAQWKEFDFENMTWTVPWQHLKTGRRYQTDKQVSISKPMYDLLMLAAHIAYPKDSSKIGDYHKRGPIFQHARHTPDVSPDAVVFPDAKNKEYDESAIARFMREHIGWKNKETSCGRYSPTITSADPTAPTSCSMNAVL
jgi:integrase